MLLSSPCVDVVAVFAAIILKFEVVFAVVVNINYCGCVVIDIVVDVIVLFTAVVGVIMDVLLLLPK